MNSDLKFGANKIQQFLIDKNRLQAGRFCAEWEANRMNGNFLGRMGRIF